MYKLVDVPSQGETWKDSDGREYRVGERSLFGDGRVVVYPKDGDNGYSMRTSDLVQRVDSSRR